MICAAVVWMAGSRLARYADRFATATGIGGAAVGLVLLGAVTSLPEVATSVTAAAGDDAPLAVNNLLGGIGFQLVVLAIVDAVFGRRAVTSTLPRADLIAQAALGIVMLAVVALAVAAGDPGVLGVGMGASSLIAVYAGCIFIARSMEHHVSWRPAGDGRHDARVHDEDRAKASKQEAKDEPLGRLGLLIGAMAVLILISGFLLTRSGEALAQQTGLGSSFFGAVFLGAATSLPEVSSAVAAVRLDRPQMAIGDVLGGNLFNLTLIFVVDAVYQGGPVLAQMGAFSIAACAIGILLKCVLIVGMVERRDKTVLRMGYDSVVMLAVYAGGVAVLYALRPAGSA